MYEEPESSKAGACLIYMVNRNRRVRGHVFKIQKEPDSPHEVACLR